VCKYLPLGSYHKVAEVITTVFGHSGVVVQLCEVPEEDPRLL